MTINVSLDQLSDTALSNLATDVARIQEHRLNVVWLAELQQKKVKAEQATQPASTNPFRDYLHVREQLAAKAGARMDASEPASDLSRNTDSFTFETSGEASEPAKKKKTTAKKKACSGKCDGCDKQPLARQPASQASLTKDEKELIRRMKQAKEVFGRSRQIISSHDTEKNRRMRIAAHNLERYGLAMCRELKSWGSNSALEVELL